MGVEALNGIFVALQAMDASVEQEPASLQSICHVRASELYPKAPMQVDSGFGDEQPLTAPFKPICGEAVEYLGRTGDGGILALSNYRLFVKCVDGTSHNIPLGLVENLEVSSSARKTASLFILEYK